MIETKETIFLNEVNLKWFNLDISYPDEHFLEILKVKKNYCSKFFDSCCSPTDSCAYLLKFSKRY